MAVGHESGLELVASERTRRVTMIHLSSGWVALAQGAGGSSQADQLHDHGMRLHSQKTSAWRPALREPATSFNLEIGGQEAGAMFGGPDGRPGIGTGWFLKIFDNEPSAAKSAD